MPTQSNLKKVTSTDWKILNLLVSGADNSDIAKELKMSRRTVKAHFQKLFFLFGIVDGIKRVKLAVLIYRSQSCQNSMGGGVAALEKTTSSDLSQVDLITGA
ncbi:MAG TPA: LuxR C-terminal-related transcriptional regulator, partial [Terriglobales bacterium]|nr:LuxR C-terminal-related transcriptional regulator [Terriglobales bacterium]